VDHADRPHPVEIVRAGRLRLRLAPGDQREQPVAPHDVVDQSDGARLIDGQRHDGKREHDGIAQRQDR